MDEMVFANVMLVPDEASFTDLGAGRAGPATEAARRSDAGTLTIEDGGTLRFAGRRNSDLAIDGITEVSLLAAANERGPFPFAVRVVHGVEESVTVLADGRLRGNQRERATALIDGLSARAPGIRVGPERHLVGAGSIVRPPPTIDGQADGAPTGDGADRPLAAPEPALRAEVEALAAARGWPRVEPAGPVGRALGGALLGVWIGLLLLVAGNRFQDMDRIVGLILGGDPIALGFVVVPALIIAGVGVFWRPAGIPAGEEAWRSWLAGAKPGDLEYVRRRMTEP